MKRLIVICLVMAVATSLSAVPVADNMWDVSGGKAVTAESTLFNNFQSAGAERWVQWQRAAADTLGCSNLYATTYEGVGGNCCRSFDCSLFAKDLSIGEFALTYGKGIAASYISIDGEGALWAQHIPASPIIVREF